MAQKDKVKELVGRGLGSYHTKALQQMDRIEKKNKEQSHKISILTNELDNDYLTKTEEGSVISLEHSKEGMVYLDELEGNTLVNYCTDGSKELTLNGDIDVEGTNVTITEGVDNGKVDVVCEGNTLVNKYFQPESNSYLANDKIVFAHQKGHIFNTKHCFDVRGWNRIITVISTTNKPVYLEWLYDNGTSVSWGGLLNNEILKSKIELPSNCSSISIGGYTSKGWTIENAQQANIIILEGDWTNKEIPTEYFEGMKSVGECEDNKIEILSSNGNYVDTNNTTQSFPYSSNGVTFSKNNHTYNVQGSTSGYPYVRAIEVGKLEPNTTYSFTCKSEGTGLVSLRLISRKYSDALIITQVGNTFTTPSDVRDDWGIDITSSPSENINRTFSEIMIKKVENTMSYKPYALNKKEISLNEPLRALSSRVKDKIVKIGGKYYVERNCGESIVDGSDIGRTDVEKYSSDNAHCVLTSAINNIGHSNVVCDKFPSYNVDDAIWSNGGDKNGVSTVSASWGFAIRLLNSLTGVEKTDDYSTVISKFRTYLQNNPIRIIYQLATPIYEELPIDPTINTYNDITHISNNSTIPCNMKIKNTGYNAIIKPSTLYTVALDTNKSGTIGINLGGAKVTTTNNVATITTPATLTDDSLRLYGKDIKGSKVRILEGDKTNWIPSHFEGMKSSFEDKLQDDGTYKMEILSNNKNLVDSSKICRWSANPTSLYHLEYPDYIPVKPNTYYRMNMDLRCVTHYDNNKKHITDTYNESFKTHNSCRYIKIRAFGREGVNIYPSDYKDFQLEEGTKVTEVVLNKSNKIQFSSIEPLRAVGDVKDRFVFKDGKLMIERNCGVGILNGSENWEKHSITDDALRKEVFVGAYWSKAPVYNATKGSLIANNVIPRNDTINPRSFYIISKTFILVIDNKELSTRSSEGLKEWLRNNPITYVYKKEEPTYEEIPFELQKIILEGYENGTLFFDTNIPPTVTTTYAGETPIVKSVRLNKTEVLNNTNDINDNIIPYLCDMDFRVVCLQLVSGIESVSMARLFGGAYEMLQRDIQSNRYSKEEYLYRLDSYLSANKISQEEYNKLGDMLND